MRWLHGFFILAALVWLAVAVAMVLFHFSRAAEGAEPMRTWRNSALLKLRKGDVDVLARTVYGEARGEKLDGMQAVAWVILNRAKRGPPRFPEAIAEVCKQKWQFTCWAPGDPNAKVCAAATEADPYFALALYAAAGVLTGNVPDPTRGSDHYHTVSMSPYPAWAAKMQLQAIIGQHRFYAEKPVR